MEQTQEQHHIRELQAEVFGDDDRREPGLKRRQTATDIELHGEGTQLGIKNKVQILWRIHIWLLCSMSAGMGAVATMLLQRMGKIP